MDRKKIFVGVLLVLVVVVMWYQFIWSPSSDDLDTAKTQQVTAEDARDRLQVQLDRAKRDQQDSTDAELRARFAKLSRAIPARPDLEGFIRAADDIKTKSGVDWVSITPTPPAAGSAVSEIALQILVRGGYFQVLDYLNRLEDLKRIVVVDSVDLAEGTDATTGTDSGSGEGTTDASGAPTLALTLNGRMFTQAAASGASGSLGGAGTTTPTTSSSGTTAATTNAGSN